MKFLKHKAFIQFELHGVITKFKCKEHFKLFYLFMLSIKFKSLLILIRKS